MFKFVFALSALLFLNGNAQADTLYPCKISVKLARNNILTEYYVHFLDRHKKTEKNVASFEECEQIAINEVRKAIQTQSRFESVRYVFHGPKKIAKEFIGVDFVQGYFQKMPRVKNQSYSLRDCEVPELDNHVLKNDGKALVPECAPDTLYAWMNQIDVQGYLSNLRDSPTDLAFEAPLVTVRNPISGYAYGNTQLRIKLKPHTIVSFKIAPTQDSAYEGEDCKKNTGITALYRLIDTAAGPKKVSIVSYLICNTNVIDSMSYDQPEAAYETLEDYKWIRSHYPEDYDLWFKYTKLHGRPNIDAYYFLDMLDDLQWEKPVLMNRLLRLKFNSEDGLGEIACRPGDEVACDRHFQTDHPNYFNQGRK